MKVYNTSSVYRCTCNTTWIFSSYFLFLCIFSRTGFGSALAGPCCSLCPLLSHQSNCPNTTGEWTNARDTEGTCIKHCAFKSRVNLDSLSFLFFSSHFNVLTQSFCFQWFWRWGWWQVFTISLTLISDINSKTISIRDDIKLVKCQITFVHVLLVIFCSDYDDDDAFHPRYTIYKA